MTHDFARCFFPLAIGMALCGTPKNADASELLVFISAFNKGDEGAIHAYQLQAETGELKLVHRTTGAEQPFFTALSPDRKFLYAIHAPGQFGGKDNEQISAYEITGPAGQLKLLNRQSSMGTASCFLEVDKTGKTLLVANYSSGSVAALPIKADGSLGEAATFVPHKAASVDATRPTVSHAHCFVVSPDNRFAFAADLGLDEILNYRLDPVTAKLTPAKQPFVRTAPGAGPRHMTFHPNGKQVYAINELKGSVTLFDFEPETGFLIEQQTISTLPKEFEGKNACTNRGHDSIASYRLADDGRLTLLNIEPSLGKGPQNLVITPNGELLLCANMPGNNVAVFKINQETGALKQVGEPISIPNPSCIRIR
jgi:6-phosphogluconolactonase